MFQVHGRVVSRAGDNGGRRRLLAQQPAQRQPGGRGVPRGACRCARLLVLRDDAAGARGWVCVCVCLSVCAFVSCVLFVCGCALARARCSCNYFACSVLLVSVSYELCALLEASIGLAWGQGSTRSTGACSVLHTHPRTHRAVALLPPHPPLTHLPGPLRNAAAAEYVRLHAGVRVA
jgi:hypothetical protein